MQTLQGCQIVIAAVMEASQSSHVLGGRLLPPSIRTATPLACIPHHSGYGLHKPIQRIFEVSNSLISLAMPDRFLDAVLDVLFQDSFAYLVKRSTHRRNLRQHIVALPALFPQAFEAVGMTGDAGEPFGDLLARRIV